MILNYLNHFKIYKNLKYFKINMFIYEYFQLEYFFLFYR
jgi:hypothetical protein